MISLICMSTHKATAARCLSYHQAASGQPAIRALATAPLRRLALSMLFTIATNSYQTTCTVSERTFNKRQHANARHGVDFSIFTYYDRNGHYLIKDHLISRISYSRDKNSYNQNTCWLNSLESANSSILAVRRHFKEVVGKKSGFYDNELAQSQ